LQAPCKTGTVNGGQQWRLDEAILSISGFMMWFWKDQDVNGHVFNIRYRLRRIAKTATCNLLEQSGSFQLAEAETSHRNGGQHLGKN